MLKFDDGVQFDTSGEYRITRRHDGLYVVGHGMLLAVSDREEGNDVIAGLKFKRGVEVDLVDDRDFPEACPGCGCKPGEGITEGCADSNGCGFLG